MDELKQLYINTWKAMIDKNEDLLRTYHNDSFVLVHMTGMKSPLEKFIKEIKTNDLDYQKVKHEHIQVEMNKEDEAIIIGDSYVYASVYGGTPQYWPLELKFYVSKINNEWKHTYCIASTYRRK